MIIHGVQDIDLNSSPFARTKIELAESSTHLYRINDFVAMLFLTDFGETKQYTIMSLLSVAINSRSDIDASTPFDQDIVARSMTVYAYNDASDITAGGAHVPQTFDPSVRVESEGNYFNDEIDLISKSLQSGVATATLEIMYRIDVTPVKKTSGLLEEMNRRRYSNP